LGAATTTKTPSSSPGHYQIRMDSYDRAIATNRIPMSFHR
jgi:hypothetical protein